MDYSDTLEGEKKIPVISTWQYQWKILHKNLKTVAQVKKEKEQKLKQQKLRQQEKRRK